MPGPAFRLLRRHPGAVFLASAIALLPAHVVKTGLLVALRYRADRAGSAGPVVRQPEERQGRLRDQVSGSDSQRSSPPGTRTEGALEAVRDLPELPTRETAVLDAILLAASLPLLAAGVYLALAAVTALAVASRAGTPVSAAQAWEVAGARFGALAQTCALASLLICVGVVLCVLPGLALALGFAFALPAVLVEGRAGIGALRRSLSLSGRVMPRLLGIALFFPLIRLAGALAAAALLPAGAFVTRLLLADAVCVLLFPWPIAALSLLFHEARLPSPRIP